MTPKRRENNMKILIVSFLTIALFSCSNSNRWEKISQNQYNNDAIVVLGDFDGDSRQDSSYLAKKENKLALIAELSSKNFSNQFVITTFYNTNIKNIGIELNPKNSLVFICAKDCEIKEQKKLSFDSIVFFENESSSSLFIYNQKKQLFDEFWLSD